MKYDDDAICVESIKKIMDIIGNKWAFIVLGELSIKTMHFNELRREIGLSTKSLSDILKKLEANGIVERKVYPTTPVTVEYSLTEKGTDFQKGFIAMCEWGSKRLFPEKDEPEDSDGLS